MVLDKLGSSLKDALQKIAKAVFVDDTIINEIIRDIQRALLQSDVNVQLVFNLTKQIKDRALNEESRLTKREHLINIVYEELTKFLGEEPKELKIDKKTTKIMLVGLFGNGKTTTAGKLTKFYKKRGYRIAAIQTDTWRPAAYEQLKQLCEQVGVDFYGIKEEKNPSKIYQSFEKHLSEYDLVIVDTAGRDALSNELIEELNNLNKLVKADERILVISADVGQSAQKQAEAFHNAVGVSGVIITRLDGTAKGGGALSACAVTNAKVMFIGTGEKVDEFELFNPKRFVSRMLGMGDIETLLEKAKEVVTEEQAEDMTERFMEGKFNLNDLYSQMEAMKKMGSLSKLMEMIPGMGQLKLPKELIDVQQENLKRWKYLMDSMTQEEKENPDLISNTRITRICKGSGVDEHTLRELLKQYAQAKKMAKMLKGGRNMKKMMKQFGGKLPPGFDPSMVSQ